MKTSKIVGKLTFALVLSMFAGTSSAQVWDGGTISSDAVYRSGITRVTGYGSNGASFYSNAQFQSIQSGAEYSGLFFNGYGDPDGVLRVKGTWTGSSSPILQVEANSGTDYTHVGNIRFTVLGNGKTGIGTGSPSKTLHVVGETYITEKLGIGTSNFTPSFRLFVKDGIRTERIRVDIAADNGWADYVFESDYDLMPLGEVEQYIQSNGHLPGIPSAAEVEADGIDLAAMDSRLLEKIEELTLHLIDANKRIAELESKLNDSLPKE